MRLHLARLAQLVSHGVHHGFAFAVSDPLARRFGRTGAPTKPVRLRLFLEELSGAFLKFGQMLALQPDIIPLEYCNELFDLLDRIQPTPYQKIHETFVEETGLTPQQAFESFERTPLATASIGQVHVACLKGRKVAVKVQRRSAESDIASDIRIMLSAVKVIKALHLAPLYWMIEPMSEFAAWTQEEIDYRIESRYMDQLRKNSQGNESERIPAVYWEFSSQRVMVVDFLEGVTVLDYLRLLNQGDSTARKSLEESLGFDPAQFARNIISNFLGDAFNHGLFHADLHPANLMILSGNQVGYIDFGITGVLSRYSRHHLVALTLAYAQADMDKMCEVFLKVSSYGESSDIEGFRTGLDQLAAQWYRRTATGTRLQTNITRVMLDMLILSKRTGIWPERDVIKYIRSSIAVDGLITRFAPEFSVGSYLEQVCSQHLVWSKRQDLLTADRFMVWFLVNEKLWTEGVPKMMEILEGSVDSEAASHPYHPPGAFSGGAHPKALLIAVVILALTLLLISGNQPDRLGVNLFTAGLLLLGASLALLCRLVLKQP